MITKKVSYLEGLIIYGFYLSIFKSFNNTSDFQNAVLHIISFNYHVFIILHEFHKPQTQVCENLTLT